MNEDITFSINKDGKIIECHVASIIPGDNDNESYILFVDPESDGLSYGKITKNNEEYKLEEFNDENIINELAKKLFDNISNFAFEKEEINNE